MPLSQLASGLRKANRYRTHVMKKNSIYIAVVLDRSGSMQSIKQDTIRGFNAFLEEQKKAVGEASIKLTQFDTEYEVVYESKKVQEAPSLTNETFVPRGGTALLDAIGRTINALGKEFSDLAEAGRPEKVVFVIITDGEENSSNEFSLDQIHQMISHQRDVYKWEFLFLGANQDAIASATRMGIQIPNSLSYAASGAGAKGAFRAMSMNVVNYRASLDPVSLGFSDEQRKEQEDLGAWTSQLTKTK